MASTESEGCCDDHGGDNLYLICSLIASHFVVPKQLVCESMGYKEGLSTLAFYQ